MASPSSFTYYCPPSSSPVWSEPLYSLRPEHARERLQDDSVETVTSIEQVRWQDWARHPRGVFWERESRSQGRPGAELTGELRLPQRTAAPSLWEAPGALAWASSWSVCAARLGKGRFKVGLGGVGSSRVRSALKNEENRVLRLENRGSPGGSDSPLRSASTSGGSGVHSALFPTCSQLLEAERREGPGRCHAVSRYV